MPLTRDCEWQWQHEAWGMLPKAETIYMADMHGFCSGAAPSTNSLRSLEANVPLEVATASEKQEITSAHS